jgi:hypothetical protein
MSDVCIITAFPASTNIFLNLTERTKVYIGDEYR